MMLSYSYQFDKKIIWIKIMKKTCFSLL